MQVVTYIPRRDWSAERPKNDPTIIPRAYARGIAVHYSDTVGATDHARCGGQVRSIQSYHQNVKNWNDIAYSFVVCQHGSAFEARGWGNRTAAQGSNEGNDGYHAVCYLSANEQLTAEGERAIADVINDCNRLGWGGDVEPHKHFTMTDCPGGLLQDWVTNRGWLNPGAGQPGGTTSEPNPVPPPAPSGPAWYTRVLSKGMSGDDVKVVQRKVQAADDGVFGPNTEGKVRGWQKVHGLDPDGVVGPKTAAALGNAAAYGQVPSWYKDVLSKGSKGTVVKIVQGKVGVKTDGDFGPNTDSAVRRFQSAHGLTVDGLVGENTAKEMGE